MKGRTGALALVVGLAIAAPAFAASSGDDGCEGARTPTAAKLTVTVAGVRSSAGEVRITVYPDNKRRFLAKGGKLARAQVKAAPSVRACFWLPPATYAVAIYHDANSDRDFDRTMVGLPAEGFGFSNDPDTKIGLPPLSAVRFRLGAGEGVVPIRMRYLR